MAVSKYKSWVPNEVLSSSDLNASFDQVFNNQHLFGTPRTAAWDMDGQELILDADADTSITADTDDKIDFRLGGGDLFVMDGTVASPVNGISLVGTATGQRPRVQAQGADTNLGIILASKGTGSAILRVNGVDLLTAADGGGTPVNGITVTNAATGAVPQIAASGTDTNIPIAISSKGSGGFALRVGSVDIWSGLVAAGTIVNGMGVVGKPTGTAPEIRSLGTDTNIDLVLTPKGTGVVKLGASTVTATPTAAAVPIADGTGKLADGWISASSVTQHVTAAHCVLVASATPAAASAVDFGSTVITATYFQYMIAYKLQVSVDDAEINLRTDTADGASVDSGASDYTFVSDTRNTTGAGADASTGATLLPLQDRGAGSGVGNAAGETAEGAVWVRHLGDAGHFPSFEFSSVHIDPTGRETANRGTGHRRSAATINFIRLLPTSGTITGEVRVYGFKAA